VPKFISLGVIVVIFMIALAYGLVKEKAGRKGGSEKRATEAQRHET